jgi:hypothetical protein
MARKYIKTKNKEIIIFSGLNLHSDFAKFEPISAGFIDLFINENGELDCKCYGESISLGLQSNPEADTRLAYIQIILNRY